MSHVWGDRFDEPTVVLTADQDWAPAWATQWLIETAQERDIPLHVFCTNLDGKHDPIDGEGVTYGIHPNFLPGSSHGATAEEVVAHCLRLVPGATTARSHAFCESTPAMQAMASQGIVADSNLCTHLEPGLEPIRHFTGLLRFPVWLEDDVLLRLPGWGLPTHEQVVEIANLMRTPGLKILNFHPSLVGANVATFAEYDDHRPDLFGDDPQPFRTAGRGIGDVLQELLDLIERDLADRVMSFTDLVTACSAPARV